MVSSVPDTMSASVNSKLGLLVFFHLVRYVCRTQICKRKFSSVLIDHSISSDGSHLSMLSASGLSVSVRVYPNYDDKRNLHVTSSFCGTFAFLIVEGIVVVVNLNDELSRRISESHVEFCVGCEG